MCDDPIILLILTHHTPVDLGDEAIRLQPLPPNFDPYDHLLTVTRLINENITTMNVMAKHIREQTRLIQELENRVNQLEMLSLMNEHIQNLEDMMDAD